MKNHYRGNIKIDRTKEARTQEISRMIDEGGLGAYKYYNTINNSPSSEKETNSQNNPPADNDN